MVNPTTGQPCKGHLAARVLARIMIDGRTRYHVQCCAPDLFAAAVEALKPFGWPDVETVEARLGIEYEESDVRRFGIYVNHANNVAQCGFLAETGGVTTDQSRAARWLTIEDANREIKSRGWENDMSYRAGRTTAYAVEVVRHGV